MAKPFARYLPMIGAIVVTAAIAIVLTTMLLRPSPKSSELEEAKQQIGRHMVLPTGEEPTLAIVEDTASLSDAYLKQYAENGDRVLLYAKAGRAIIYRPSIDKIVMVAPVTIDKAQAQSYNATIRLLNGTTNGTVVDYAEQVLKAKYPNVVISKAQANRSNYTQSLVINQTEGKDELFVQLLDLFKAGQGVVPLGEDAGSSNMTILIGDDMVSKVQL
ncbi:MAG: hypothetical protein WAT17_01895 [Candidatus Saccharimonadales bacterium]|jgi:hypothetical protein